MTGLSALGLALGTYLGWHYLMGSSMIGCGGGAPGCEAVLSSRWSTIAGVLPVSGLAAGTYLAMLLASLFIGPATAAPDRRLAWGAMLILVGAAAGSAVWFTILQVWIIDAFCPYCMAAHITGLLLTALVIWQAPRQLNHSTDVTVPRRLIGTRPAIGLPMLGLALAGILSACQVVLTPPQVYRDGESQNVQPVIDPHTAPLAGSPDAPHVVTLLFDYKCPHCQKIHSMLDEAIHRYNGELAFILCPAPLNNQCNPYISREVEEFKDSCELAKVGLAVWAAKRDAFAEFDRWMFSSEPGEAWHARSPDTAKAKAVELVGKARFDAALADPWIDRFMQTSILVYGHTIGPDQSGNAVPKLVFGSRWVTPDPNDTDEFISILQTALAVPRP